MAQNNFKNLLDIGGLITKWPSDKIPDRNASDIQNIDLSLHGQIQTAGGWRLFGNKITTPGKNLRGFLYVKNYGTLKKIMLRVRDDGTNSHLEWFNESNPDTSDGKWETLVANLTKDKIMGFASCNGNNASAVNLLVFCNGAENYSTWNGATGLLSSVTSNTIIIEEDIAEEGFDTSSGSIIIDGTTYTYTGTSGSTFTGVTPDPTTQNPVAKSGVAQIPDTSSYSENPKGNVLATNQRKIFLSGVSKSETKVHHTNDNNVTDFTIASGLAGGGTFDVIEGGGEITALHPLGKNQIIIHKEDAIISYIRDNDGTNAIENFDTLAEGDDIGATNIKGFAMANQEVYFVSQTEGLKRLSKAISDSSLNFDSITDVILPTIENYDFSEASVVYFAPKKAIYVACKSSSSKTNNDKVIVYYIKRTPEGNIIGDLSIDDMFVADWIVYDKKLYALASNTQNCYLMFDRKSNDGTPRDHKWVSKHFTFNEPANDKEFNILYVEGFVANRTKIKVTVQYGLLGSDGEVSNIIAWNDDFVQTQKVGALGMDVIGTNSLGAASTDIQDSYIFQVPIHIDTKRSTTYRIKFETYYDEETDESGEVYWAIKNISTNPTLKGVDHNKIINTNI